ncbi:MAG: phosphomannomutase/phosphoglucomutase, partial [Patescibacteria group bacterium]
YCVRAQSGELNFTVADKALAITKIKEAFADARQSELDGLTVAYPDWWCNVRPSNTEPFLRVNIEADTQEALNIARKKIESIITQ